MPHLPAENSPMTARSMNGYYPAFPFPLPLLLDGATGTAMIRAGMPAGACPEKWILEHPEPLIRLQKRYLSAGSDAVLSPTFGANRMLLSRYSLADETISMNAALAALSRKAAGVFPLQELIFIRRETRISMSLSRSMRNRRRRFPLSWISL